MHIYIYIIQNQLVFSCTKTGKKIHLLHPDTSNSMKTQVCVDWKVSQSAHYSSCGWGFPTLLVKLFLKLRALQQRISRSVEQDEDLPFSVGKHNIFNNLQY